MPAYLDDRNLVPEFKVITIPNDAKSKAAGRPIFDELEVVEIRYGGDMQNRPVFPAHDGVYIPAQDGTTQFVTYAERFSKQYRRFKDNKAQAMDGTPLEEATFLSQKQRSELRGLQIYTVEQLASLDDRRLKSLGMDGRSLMNQAQAYLTTAAGNADATRLAAENAELRLMIEQLQAQATSRPALQSSFPPVETGDDAPSESFSEVGRASGQASSEFDNWDVEELKSWIAEQTGSRPRGNPSRETLVAMAEELNGNQA